MSKVPRKTVISIREYQRFSLHDVVQSYAKEWRVECSYGRYRYSCYDSSNTVDIDVASFVIGLHVFQANNDTFRSLLETISRHVNDKSKTLQSNMFHLYLHTWL